jgi:hypothetical protein
MQLALPFGFLGLVAAFYISDFWCLAQTGDETTVRGILVCVIPLVASALGFALSLRSLARSRASTAAVLVLATLIAGLSIGGLAGSVFQRGPSVGGSVEMGLLTSIGILPLVAGMSILARRVGRARVGSLLDEADRRAPWVVVLACAAAGRVALVLNGSVLPNRPPLPNSVSLGIAWLALVVSIAALLCDLVGYARVARARRRISGMIPRDPSTALPCSDVVDLGLGAEEHEELIGGPAYRSVALPLAVVKGAPDLAAAALGHAARRSAFIVGAAVIAVTVVPLLRSM